MAFAHQPLGALVATNPVAALAQLADLYKIHRTREAVAKALGADARTLARWILKLKAHGDPRPKKPEVEAESKKIAAKPRQKAKPRKARKKVVAR